MMKCSTSALLLLILFSSQALAVSVLRVHCSSDAEGAEIFVNGESKGYCPTDLFVSPGEKTLRAVKPVGDDRERVFETRFILAEDGAKRVTVELSGPQLTAEAKRKRREARLAREKKAAEQAQEKAEDGDPEAMRELAGYYRGGQGVPQNPEKAEAWETRASEIDARRSASRTLERARAGSILAMQRMADRYESGDGVPQDAKKANEWRGRADRTIAKNTLEKAEKGDVASMKAMARFYREGKGVEADPQKAQEWEARAENLIAEREKRKTERQERAAARERNAKLQAAIDDTSYFENVTDMMTGYFESMEEDGPIAFTFGIPSSPLPMAAGLLSDASQAPTKSTDVAIWKSRMTTRPSAFENPDSMIARAYADQPERAD